MRDTLRSLERGAAASVVSLLVLAGCSSIHEETEIKDCPNNGVGLIEATLDSDEPGYNELTDPGWLAREEYARAEEIQDGDDGWNIRNQVVGIGLIACESDDGSIFLTTEGASLSRELG